MSDVEIVVPPGREAAARRLRDALVGAGYDADSREADEKDRAPDGSGASAVLILWDRSTMAHPALQAAASAARRRGRAIDVSADGITPLDLEDDRTLIHLSGWRGDPHHPGWRKILARLEQLCRKRENAPPTRPAPPAPKADAAAPAARPAAEQGRAPPRARTMTIAFAAAILLLVVAAAALLMSRHSPAMAPQPPLSPAPAAKPAAVPQAPPPVIAAGSPAESGQAAQPPRAAAPDIGMPVAEPRSAPLGTAPVPEAKSPEALATDRVAASRRVHAAKTHPDRHRPAIRYTRYSRNMRLFCERAGRSTPQCRLFRAATGR